MLAESTIRHRTGSNRADRMTSQTSAKKQLTAAESIR
jgi:hypothetical protein